MERDDGIDDGSGGSATKNGPSKPIGQTTSVITGFRRLSEG